MSSRCTQIALVVHAIHDKCEQLRHFDVAALCIFCVCPRSEPSVEGHEMFSVQSPGWWALAVVETCSVRYWLRLLLLHHDCVHNDVLLPVVHTKAIYIFMIFSVSG